MSNVSLAEALASGGIEKIMCTYLKEFDYKNNDTLPAQLLQHLRISREPMLSCGDRILSKDDCRVGNGAMKDYFRKKGYNIFEDRIVVLYFPKEGKDIYYDFKTGKRVCDDIGSNDWFLKKNSLT